MSRRPARFTEADLRRAAKVAKAMGVTVVLEGGTVRVIPTDSPTPKQEPIGEEREIVL